jgi:hypothetical protein
VIGAAVAIWKLVPIGPSNHGPLPTPVAAATSKCYTLKMIPEETIPISSVDSSKWFVLLFQNHCNMDLRVQVEYRVAGGNIVVTPPESWPGFMIAAGEDLEQKLTPPNLALLNKKPGMVVQIDWSIFRADDHTWLDEKTAMFRLE